MTKNNQYAIQRAAARNVLAKCGVTSPSEINLELIAGSMDVVILEDEVRGSSARLVTSKKYGIITINRLIQETGRKRFAAAHELGHYVCHRNKSSMSICTDENFLDYYARSSQETESNIFAAELLMPEYLFGKKCECTTPSFHQIAEIAEDFKTSLTATAFRFVELTNHPCALIASKDGKVKWFVVHEDFPYRVIGVGSSLHNYSLAFDYFKEFISAGEAETMLGEAWLEDVVVGRNCFIVEDLKVLPSYRTTLSLIWIKEDRNQFDSGDF